MASRNLIFAFFFRKVMGLLDKLTSFMGLRNSSPSTSATTSTETIPDEECEDVWPISLEDIPEQIKSMSMKEESMFASCSNLEKLKTYFPNG